MENIKLFCVSLGCDKNLVDTEKMLGLLNGQGIIFTDDETEADVILVNTCCFIGDAKEESVNTILDMARYKEEGNLKALLVAGCLAQRFWMRFLRWTPSLGPPPMRRWQRCWSRCWREGQAPIFPVSTI